MDNCSLRQRTVLQDAKQCVQAELTSLQDEYDTHQRERSQILSNSEPIPARSSQIQATRTQLIMQGIPHTAFYEAVDFSPDLSQAARDQLEAQLADAGLLDALIVPEAELPHI